MGKQDLISRVHRERISQVRYTNAGELSMHRGARYELLPVRHVLMEDFLGHLKKHSTLV